MKSILPRSVVLRALSRLIAPLVRFSLKHSIKLQDFIEVAKHSYVNEAGKSILSTEEEPTAARIALVSGVHRKDVTRISREGSVLPEDLSIVARIIGQWRGDLRFLDKSGRPRILSLEGQQSDFKQLVGIVSKELNAGIILAELERIRAVKRIGSGLKLTSPAYMPIGDSRKGLDFLASDIEDLFQSVEENLSNPNQSLNLHIKTVFDSIDEKAIPEIRHWLLREGSKFHTHVEKYLREYDTDINPEIDSHGSKYRIAIGSFSRCELSNTSKMAFKPKIVKNE